MIGEPDWEERQMLSEEGEREKHVVDFYLRLFSSQHGQVDYDVELADVLF